MSDTTISKKELAEELIPEFLDASVEEDVDEFDEDIIRLMAVDEGDTFTVELSAEDTDIVAGVGRFIEVQTAIETLVRSAVEERTEGSRGPV